MTIDRLMIFGKYTIVLLSIRSIMHMLISMKLKTFKEKLVFIKEYWLTETLTSLLIMLGSIILLYLPLSFESLAAYTATLSIAAFVPWRLTFKRIVKNEDMIIPIIKSSLLHRRIHMPLFSVAFPLVLSHSECPLSLKIEVMFMILFFTILQYAGFRFWLSTIKEKHV